MSDTRDEFVGFPGETGDPYISPNQRNQAPVFQFSDDYDENPPAYETMYPEFPNIIQERHGSVILQPVELLPLQISRRNAWDEQNMEQNKETSENSSKENSPTDLRSDRKGVVKNEKKGNVLEHRSTFSELSRVTKKKIITQATGFKETAIAALREFCQNTTAHGFSHIIEPSLHVIFKTFWMVITVTSLFVLAYMAYQVTLDNFVIRRPTTEVNHRDNRTVGLTLPHITICSLSGFWKSKLEEHNMSSSLASYILLSIRGINYISPLLMTDVRRQTNLRMELRDYMKDRNVSLSELVLQLSPSCEDVISFCYINNTLSPHNQCCNTYFRTVITTSGVCFTTIGKDGPTVSQTVSGISGGMSMVFPFREEEYVDYDPNIIFTLWMSDEGTQISVSDYTMLPSVSADRHPFRIAPNTAATMALSMMVVDHSERYSTVWPWGNDGPDCLTKFDYLGQTEEEIAYTENNEYFTLLNRDCSLNITNCTTLPSRFNNDTSDECTPQNILEQAFLNNNISTCVTEKLQEPKERKKLCYTNTYTQQLSYTRVYNQSVARLQEANLLPPGNFSMVRIFYSHLGYTELLERTPDFMTWFSDMGGQMGLFLGASFITLVELTLTAFYIIRMSFIRAAKAFYLILKRLIRTDVEVIGT